MIRTTLIAALTAALPAMASAGSLKVAIEGVEARGGTFYISVQTRDQFMQDTGVAGTVEENPEAGTFDVVYDLEPGEYAVTVWHDDNGNGTFDTGGQWNVPLDGWAMKNAMNLRAAPTFDDVKITVDGEGTTLNLPMIYGRGS